MMAPRRRRIKPRRAPAGAQLCIIALSFDLPVNPSRQLADWMRPSMMRPASETRGEWMDVA
jgi:hypothetical protein